MNGSPGMKHRALRRWSRDGYAVIDCADCGFRHLYPFPNHQELSKYYREHYHRLVKPFPYDGIDEPCVDRNRQEMLSNPEFRKIFASVAGFLPGAGCRAMLDIGCGNSLLAAHFNAHGWRGKAIEPNRDAAGYLRRFGIDVLEVVVDELAGYLLEPVSFVNLQFVLEHVPDPAELLIRLADVVVPGGVIRVTVPNDFSPGQMAWLHAANVEPPWISYPDHINYFDFDSLSQLLRKYGFTEIDRRTNFPLEWLLLTGTDYYHDEATRDAVGPKVKSFEQAWRQSGQGNSLDELYRALAGLGMGRSATLYAIRT